MGDAEPLPPTPLLAAALPLPVLELVIVIVPLTEGVAESDARLGEDVGVSDPVDVRLTLTLAVGVPLLVMLPDVAGLELGDPLLLRVSLALWVALPVPDIVAVRLDVMLAVPGGV